MIPVHLRFRGLYSYQKAQSIDFEQLTASQLFGIFGSVGSGKSTILEAMMFALYDRSDRLNKSGDNRYYNMLNLQSNTLEIDFVFRANAQSATKYRAYFSARRKKKDFEKVEVKERGHYEWKNEQWVPLEITDASEVLGMTYENFMQTVIIPQGKFREFIDQRPTVRTQMLKELFQLHRFDLGAKTGNLLRKTELAIADLEARLLEIGQVSEQDIAAQREALKEMEITLNQQQLKNADLQQQCQRLDTLKKLLDKIRETEQELNHLQQQSAFFVKKEQQLRAYMKAETFFNEKFKLLEETTIAAQQAYRKLKEFEERIAAGKQKIQRAKTELLQRQKEFQLRERILQQILDLQHLIQVRELQPKCQQSVQKVSSIQQTKQELEHQQAKQQEAIDQYEDQLSDTSTDQDTWQTLQEVNLWALRQQQLEQEYEQTLQELEEYEKNLKLLQEQTENILSSYGWPGSAKNEELVKEFADFQSSLHLEQDGLQKALSELRVREKLAQAAEHLQPGQPCLLCGSTEHPQIAHHPSVKKSLDEKLEALAELRQKEKSFRELQQAVQKIVSQSETVRTAIDQAKQRCQQLTNKKAQHQRNHHWPEYKSVNFTTLQNRLESMGQNRKKLENCRQLRKQAMEKLKTIRQKLAGVQKEEQQLLQERAGWKAKIEQHQSMVQTLDPSEFANTPLTQLREKLTQSQQKITAIESNYEQSRQDFQEYQNALQIVEGQKEVLQENYSRLTLKANTLNEEIQSLCLHKDFGSISEVKQLIELELDTDREQEEVLTYRNQLHNAEVTLHKLQLEIQGQTYAEAEHHKLQEEKNEVEASILDLQEKGALLRQRIADWLERLRRGESLGEQLQQQRLRELNLKELVSLFRGSGFVNYASTVLLENLCRVANQRFMKLTHNSLSLELNSENEFIIRDYMNEGKTRLLKTLSGGQIFQASLCLALALAENVKSLNQADQSFFFLDEGFGSLDRESLSVVFDTLKSLRKENRVVGIISHVEALQHEIDVYLKIEKDRQKGSSIQASWEL